MAKPRKHKDGYRIEICVNGIRESKVLRTIRECTAWAESRKSELRSVKKLPPGERHTLKQALEKYRDEVCPNNRGERWETLRIYAFLRDAKMPCAKSMAEVSPSDIAIWRDSRLKEVGAGTVLRELGILSAMFEVAKKEWQWVTINPVKEIRKPPEPAHRDRVISRWEIRAMLSSLGYKRGQCRGVSQAVAHCFLLALRTGMRAGELCSLRWDQVNTGYLSKVGTKTVPRDVPLSIKASRIVNSMKGYDPVLVFGIKAQSLDAIFRKHRERAGLDGFTFHDSRHTAATWMAQKLHVLDLCKVFGWSNTKRALTYYNPSAAEIAGRL